MVCYQGPISCGVPARATYKLSTYRLRPFHLTFEKVGGGMTTRAHVRAHILHAKNSWNFQLQFFGGCPSLAIYDLLLVI